MFFLANVHKVLNLNKHTNAKPTCKQTPNCSRVCMSLCTNVIHNKAYRAVLISYTHTHTPLFNGPLYRTTRVRRYQKGKTNLDFTEARDSKWQWHQLAHMQVCTSLQTDNHASTPPLSFFTGQIPFYHPTNSVKALK